MDQQLNARVGDPLELPAPAPLPMPSQPLRAPRRARDWRVWLARTALLLLVSSGTAAFAISLYKVLSVETPTWLQLVFWVASTLCFASIAIGSATSVIGFVLMVGSNREVPLDGQGRSATDARTALLFPVYAEDPVEVAAAIDAVSADLAHCSAGFDIFVLSDTQDLARREFERYVYARLAADISDRVKLYARWRTPNTAKKAGNIQDWVTAYGGAYRYFVVLDADSVMTGETLVGLVSAMEREPELGLLQTVPRLVGSETVFARAQQFAAAYYGPLVATGLSAWQGDSGNYWGHNAIIRTQAFATSAGLPELQGKPPLGGHILSHDFVEAALLVRSGWRVRLAPHACGSFEGCPPTLADLLIRDRRWAQGNLQHMKILGAWRLAAISRLQLILGAWSYLASPVWAATLFVGVVLALEARFANPKYFGTEISLFPKWPVFDAQKALILFIVTLGIVHLPKVLGIVWAMRSRHRREDGDGALRLIVGMLFESVLAALIAPILMVSQTSAVLAVLAGRDAGWGAQRRSGGDSLFSSHVRRHRWHITWGIAVAVACAAISWQVLAWMLPVVLGMVGSAAIAMATSRPAPRWAAWLLATPEDLHPPAVLVAREHCRRNRGQPARTRCGD